MTRKQRSVYFIVVVLLFVLCVAGSLKKASLWRGAIVRGQKELSQAMWDLRQTGHLRDYSNWVAPFIFTNSVTIYGSNYQCALAYNDPYFYNGGFLAITTNNVFIYFDRQHGQKLIPTEGPSK